MIIREFFQQPLLQNKISRHADLMLSMHDTENIYRLGQMLKMIATNPAEFDKGCYVNINWVGDSFEHALNKAAPPFAIEAIDELSTFIYRFLMEYDISIQNDLSMEVRNFLSDVETRAPSMSPRAQANVDYANRKMPVSILKTLLNTSTIGTIRDISALSVNIENRITEWEEKLKTDSEKAEKLSDVFQSHTTAFNFVGLHQGFKDLETTVLSELKWAQKGIWLFGALVLVPGVYDLFIVIFKNEIFKNLVLTNLIAAGIGTLTLTLLLLYFFRIVLRKADDCRAQLTQIRLRMSLCRFVQSYADYSKEIRDKNPDALAKFEALIFSGIGSTSEKLPSSFDGIEQLTNLFKSMREKS